MKITVILCTYNRAAILPTALQSVAASKLPDSVHWEVLVVDNNSKDNTKAIVADFMARFPGRFRYLFEPRQGKSNALNAGIRASEGEIIAFLDDDVTVEPTWLANLSQPLLSGEWFGAGGRVKALHTVPLPPWLSFDPPYDLGGTICGTFDCGEIPGELLRAPNGSCMAYRRQIFERFGLFRTDLGPSDDGDTPRPNEDTEFGRRVLAAGIKLRYEPCAIIYHPVVSERLHKNYFLTWWFDFGRALIREKGQRRPFMGLPRHVFSIPSLIVRCLSVRAFRWLTSVHTQKRFYWKCWVWMTMGQITEIHRQANRFGRPTWVIAKQTSPSAD